MKRYPSRYIIYINGYSIKGCYHSKRKALSMMKELKRIVEEGTHLVLHEAYETDDDQIGIVCLTLEEWWKPFRKRRKI